MNDIENPEKDIIMNAFIKELTTGTLKCVLEVLMMKNIARSFIIPKLLHFLASSSELHLHIMQELLENTSLDELQYIDDIIPIILAFINRDYFHTLQHTLIHFLNNYSHSSPIQHALFDYLLTKSPENILKRYIKFDDMCDVSSVQLIHAVLYSGTMMQIKKLLNLHIVHDILIEPEYPCLAFGTGSMAICIPTKIQHHQFGKIAIEFLFDNPNFDWDFELLESLGKISVLNSLDIPILCFLPASFIPTILRLCNRFRKDITNPVIMNNFNKLLIMLSSYGLNLVAPYFCGDIACNTKNYLLDWGFASLPVFSTVFSVISPIIPVASSVSVASSADSVDSISIVAPSPIN
jgi:hypothetical protein